MMDIQELREALAANKNAYTDTPKNTLRDLHEAAQHLLTILEAVENGAKLVEPKSAELMEIARQEAVTFYTVGRMSAAIDAAPCMIKQMMED